MGSGRARAVRRALHSREKQLWTMAKLMRGAVEVSLAAWYTGLAVRDPMTEEP